MITRGFNFIVRKFNGLICKVRSKYYTSLVTEGNGRILITDPYIKFKIKKLPGAKFILKGDLTIVPFLATSPISITLSTNSVFQIDGDFRIGNGVSIHVGRHSKLYIGGRNKESASGITSTTSIMVYKSITIGKDFLCAWDVFISDSDWHSIEGQSHQADVVINDHVWVAHKTSILKGTTIEDGCIVASHSKLINKSFPANSLIGGTPAKVLKAQVKWNRDIIE